MKFIVIEGLDGSGKSTQLKKIKRFFDQKQIPFEYVHFPRTETPVYGDLIARFLRGELGDINQVNPYLIALIYAGDRNEAAKTVRSWINEGRYVIVDRYVYSNIAFQCAKIKKSDEKKALRDWIKNLEYEHNNIPKPDLNLFLDVPFSFTKRNLTQDRQGEDRDYLQGKKDIHEDSLSFQENVRNEYLALLEEDPSFLSIKCSNSNDEILSPDEIFSKIETELKKIIR